MYLEKEQPLKLMYIHFRDIAELQLFISENFYLIREADIDIERAIIKSLITYNEQTKEELINNVKDYRFIQRLYTE